MAQPFFAFTSSKLHILSFQKRSLFVKWKYPEMTENYNETKKAICEKFPIVDPSFGRSSKF